MYYHRCRNICESSHFSGRSINVQLRVNHMHMLSLESKMATDGAQGGSNLTQSCRAKVDFRKS